MSELDLTNIAGSSISTPASGITAVYIDTFDKKIRTKDDTGFVYSDLNNNSGSTAAQTPAATTRTYITGTKIGMPTTKLQIGSMFRWTFSMTKTAAGTAATTFDIAVGTAGTTADTARVSFAKPGGTAAADEAWVTITAICRGPLSASGVMVGQFEMTHNLAATGHAVIPVVVVNTVSSGFDVTTAGLNVGICITSGASDAITIQFATAEAWNV